MNEFVRYFPNPLHRKEQLLRPATAPLAPPQPFAHNYLYMIFFIRLPTVIYNMKINK